MFWSDLPKPMVALAPMDGYTDQPFRLLVREIEPRAVLFTEFLSADGIVYGAAPILKDLQLEAIESPLVVQIFGKDPDVLAKAAQYVQARGADAIDVNMGCPAKKVVNSLHGSALMKNIDLACRIVEKMKAAVDIPVSVKTRLGWEDSESLIPFVSQLASAGLDHITIHGRTYSQAFKGEADWSMIYELKKHMEVTVLGNGDVNSWQTAKEKLGNLDGVMVGRATFGNPWLIREIAEHFYNDSTWSATEMTLEEKLPVIVRHIQLSHQYKGYRGMLEIRKHLASYVRGVHSAAAYRSKLVTVENPEEAIALVTHIAEEDARLRAEALQTS